MYIIGISIKEPYPIESGDAIKLAQQMRQAMFDSEVFAVISRILTDEEQFLDSLARQPVSFAEDRSHRAAAEPASHLGNYTERAGVITAFGYLDVGGVAGCREDPGRALVVQVERTGWRSRCQDGQ